MTSDDEVLARLRASLHAHAATTPIGANRFVEVRDAADAAIRAGGPPHPAVAIGSAAAAVIVVAGAVAMVASVSGGGGGQSGVGGGGLSVLAGESAGTSAAATTSTTGPAGSTSATGSGGSCVPENFYVLASKQQLAGLTYLLAKAPAGYHLDGAWGTISRNGCADSATWYVEYRSDVGGRNVELRVQPVDSATPGGQPYSSAVPTPATSVAVGGHSGIEFGKGAGFTSVDWTVDGAELSLDGPAQGSYGTLLDLAKTVVAVAPDDSRIQPPAGCAGASPGEVCGGHTASPSSAANPSATPTSR